MLILTVEENTASPSSIPLALADSGKGSSSGGVGKRAQWRFSKAVRVAQKSNRPGV